MGFVLPKWGIHPCAERVSAPGNFRCFSDEGEAEKLLVPPHQLLGDWKESAAGVTQKIGDSNSILVDFHSF